MFLKNQVNLITGACGRIGSATSKECAKRGSDLIIADIDIQNLKNLRTLILNSYNIEILAIECDVTNHSDLKSLIKKSFNFRGFVNGAINSAYPTSSKWGCKFEELEEENLNVDLFSQLGSAILFSKEISKLFVNQGYGNLINISSIQGISAPKFDHYDGTDMNSPIEYAAIKSGIISITKWLAKYYKGKGMRINCISPGGIKGVLSILRS